MTKTKNQLVREQFRLASLVVKRLPSWIKDLYRQEKLWEKSK